MEKLPTYKDMHHDDAFLLLIGKRFTVFTDEVKNNICFTIGKPHKNRALYSQVEITWKENGVIHTNHDYSRKLLHKFICDGSWRIIK